MNKEKLRAVNKWAQDRIDSGEEPPWTLEKLKILASLSEEFAGGFDSTTAFCPGLRAENSRPADNVIAFGARPRAEEDPFLNMPA